MLRQLIPFLLVCVCSGSLRAKDNVTFNKDVRPILADKCFHCHGPDQSTRAADLRLDNEGAATQQRSGRAAVIAGDVQNSELTRRILTHDNDLLMPPLDSGKSLTADEKQILITWIQQGAHWEDHWAFIPPQPQQAPAVRRKSWPKNAIDAFVLHRLEAEGIEPSPEADREKWLRRVSFDLTGLPPTLQQLDEFLGDKSETAFATVVDRLLASPQYGEHMAAMWLDAARYADTDGYQNDGPRTMYRWRDWVIDAYNSNMPFDQFTVEQLAGDLLPDATLSQRIATGFNRNHRYNSEAGLVLEEFLLENAVDRVDTTSTVWMGLTMGCGRCHDHKYDPFTQREYYQLISFFDNVAESGRAIKFGNSEPWVSAPTDEQQQQLEHLDDELAHRTSQLETAASLIDPVMQNLKETLRHADTTEDFFADGSLISRGLTHYFPFDDMQAEGISIETGKPNLREGQFGKAATVGGNGVLTLGKTGDISCHTRSTISFWLKPGDLKNGIILSRQQNNTRRPGFCVELKDGHLQFYIVTRWIAGVGAVETVSRLTENEWVHIALTNDGSQRAKGQQIWINGRLAETKTLFNTNSNTGGTSKESLLRLGGGVHGTKFKGQLDELRFHNRTLFADEIAVLAEPRTIAELLLQPAHKRTESGRDKLTAWLRKKSSDDNSAFKSLTDTFTLFDRYDELRNERIKLLDSFPTSMVMEERPQPAATHIRIRGAYDAFGEEVASGTPGIFPAMPQTNEPSRLRFARWLVSNEHPLTARVAVNRYWQQFFGTGLVDTPEDFGVQGNLPSHPELLDWLAIQFSRSGWNVKAMQKLIVLSATYRQSSKRQSNSPDPLNRLLSRGPRIRLAARQLRDQALFVSGLMTPQIGGPSVSPYQPAGLWQEMSNMKYKQSKGKALYRRGLYTIWKRTVAPPGLAILDAADRENCTVRPKRTNTPLQALTLLNETTFIEAARHLATRMIVEGGEKPVEFAFRTVTSRFPSEQELLMLQEALQTYRIQFSSTPQAADQLVTVGESACPGDIDRIELAANTMLCNVILNLDEAVTKE